VFSCVCVFAARFRLPGAALADEVVRATRAQFTAVDGLWGQLLPMTSLFFCMAFVNTLLDAVKARSRPKYHSRRGTRAAHPHPLTRRLLPPALPLARLRHTQDTLVVTAGGVEQARALRPYTHPPVAAHWPPRKCIARRPAHTRA
jgi:hypothetical protein